MAETKYFMGSVGPLLYDDEDEINDPSGDFAGILQGALTTEGQIAVFGEATEDYHAVTLGGLPDAIEEVLEGGESTIVTSSNIIQTLANSDEIRNLIMDILTEGGFKVGTEIVKGDNVMDVFDSKRAAIDALLVSMAAAQARKDEETYGWSNVDYDYDAGDTILLLANEHSTKELVIDHIENGGDAATEVIIHRPTYPTLAGTAVTGVPLTGNNTAQASCYADETGNTQANVIFRTRIMAGESKSIPAAIANAIRLGYQECVAVDFTTAGTACTVSIVGHYE